MSTDSTQRLHEALASAQSRYIQSNPRSKALHEAAVQAFPGGNTRTVLHASPFPLCIKSGRGYQVTSEDDEVYTDFTGEFSAALYGHSNEIILSAISETMQTAGMNVGATTAQEQRFARDLCQRFHLERVRFANSGTEANLHALAAAKRFTGRRKVVAFGSAYHGGVLGFPGNKPAPNCVDRDDWVIARFNDLDSAVDAIKSDGVAAIIMEGMQGNGGCISGTREFLQGVQKAAREAGVLFILDEVMTSRVSGNGLAGLIGLNPDLRTFGKYLGGGLAFGAFGGRADVMAVFDPRDQGSLSHSGTFNNNTLVTAAGHAGLTQVFTPDKADEFRDAGDRFRARLNKATEGTKISYSGLGSLMQANFSQSGKREFSCKDEYDELSELRDLYWFEMLAAGFWTTRRGYMAMILETPQSELDRFVEAVAAFVFKYSTMVSTKT